MNIRIPRLISVFSVVSIGALAVGALTVALTVAPVVAAGSCEGLASLTLPGDRKSVV